MNETAPKKTPLWKQILGAGAGAAAAFMLYQAYSFAAPQLTALVTLPSAPGVDRTATVSEPRVEIAESSSSAQSVAGTVPLGSENRVMYGPFGWLRNAKKLGFDPGSSSSVSSTETAQVAAPAAAAVDAAEATSMPAGEPIPLSPPRRVEHAMRQTSSVQWAPLQASSSSQEVFQEETAAAVMATEMEQESSSSEEFVEEQPAAMALEQESSSSEEAMPAPYEPPAPLMATMTEHSDQLPQSGFGLELIGLTALGAALGRRATKRSVAKFKA